MKKGLKTVLKFIPILACVVPFFLFAFHTDSHMEEIASIINTLGVKSTSTGSVCLNIESKAKVDYDDFTKLINYSDTNNINKFSKNLYTIRTALNSSESDYKFLEFDLDQGNYYSMMPHLTRGDIHLNEKNEYVFGNFELKVLFNKDTKTDFTNYDTFCEIRSSLADKILLSCGKTPSMENYEWLIDSGYSLNSTYRTGKYEKKIRLQIMNIIMENKGYDEFYTKTLGDYILFYPNSITDFTHCFISADFGSSLSDTKSLLTKLTKDFEPSLYEYKINKLNFKNNDYNFLESKLNQYISTKNDDRSKIADALIVIISVVFCLVAIMIVLFNKIEQKFILFYFVSYFVIYNVLMVLNYFLSNIFSVYFTQSAIIPSFITLLVICFIIFLQNRKRLCDKKTQTQHFSKKQCDFENYKEFDKLYI